MVDYSTVRGPNTFNMVSRKSLVQLYRHCKPLFYSLCSIWGFPQIKGTLFGVLIIRVLVFRVLKQGPPFSETPI